jgi:streptomycin 6-kinase
VEEPKKMDIPDYYLQKASNQFGQKGPGWVKQLPNLLARCLERWELVDCQPIPNLSINLVCFAKSKEYGDVVLKIQGPHSERHTEMTALELYAGRNTCQCLKSDRELAAMLLERVMPGNDLRTVPSKEQQLIIGTDMLCQLPILLDGNYGFPSYRDWLKNAFTMMVNDYQPDDRFKKLMDDAWEFYKLVNSSENYLLHGDLHHENMLQDGASKWKVIDPQGVIGSPVFECGRFIENHVIDERGLNLEEAYHTISYIADRMKKPQQHIAIAFYILHLLSICWGFEMNYTTEQLAQGALECAQIRRMIEMM